MRISDWSSDVCSSDLFTGPALAAAGLEPLPDFSSEEIASNARRWRILQQRGKRLTVLRLAKASFTFAGGIDYLAWKINRHAGTAIVLDRKSVVEGTSVSERVDLGGRRTIKKKKK